MNFNLGVNRGKIEDRTLVRYLLGEMSEREQNRVEEQIFSGENYTHLLAVEESMVEDYICGQMAMADRLRFEKHYLASPSRRLRMETTRRLYEVLGNGRTNTLEFVRTEWPAQSPLVPAPEPIRPTTSFRLPLRQLSISIAMLAIIVAGIWLGVQNLRLRSQSARLQSDLTALHERQQSLRAEQDTRIDGLLADLHDASLQPPMDEVIAVIELIPSLLLRSVDSSRGEGKLPRLAIPRKTSQFRLQLEFPPSNPKSRLQSVIETAAGKPVLSQWLRPASPGRANLILNSRLFDTDDYILTLKAPSAANELIDIADYPFTIVIK